MNPDLAFAYAQARLQARYGSRVANADWQQVAATRDPGAILQLVRGTPLARWTGRLAPRAGAHEIERGLRAEWITAVDEVAGWQPEPWREAVRWMQWLPYLESLQKLARGGHAPAWMRDDPVLGPVVAHEPRERRHALATRGLAALAFEEDAAPDVAAAWLDHWRTLWPGPAPARAQLERVLRSLDPFWRRLREAPPEADSTAVLSSVERQLELAFRRHPLSPVAAVTYLGLLALDVRRLRGALAVAALRDASTVLQ